MDLLLYAILGLVILASVIATGWIIVAWIVSDARDKNRFKQD